MMEGVVPEKEARGQEEVAAGPLYRHFPIYTVGRCPYTVNFLAHHQPVHERTASMRSADGHER